MMKSAYQNLCPRCLRVKKTPDMVCPYCGQDPSDIRVPAGALEPFTMIGGRYLLGLPVGEGGFGIVYIALNMSLGNIWAVKELFPAGMMRREGSRAVCATSAADPDTQEKAISSVKEHFIREARTLARLQEQDRDGIVFVCDLFEENGTAYMVMEYLDGQSLKNYIALHGPQSYEWTIHLLRPVMHSLEGVHRMGVIHRDVSPDNMMILENGHVKLLDFGGSKDLSGDERSRFIQVKRGYTPPEQYGASGQAGPWSDVYALCATICYCLTGKTLPPPMDLSPEDVSRRFLSADHVPGQARTAILRGLCPDPAKRIRSMKELSDALPEEGHGTERVWVQGAARSRPRTGKGLAKAGTAAVIAAGILAGGAVYDQMSDTAGDKTQVAPLKTGPETILPEGVYELACTGDPDRRLSVQNNMGVDGSNVCLMPADGGNDQKFILSVCGEGYSLKGAASGLYVDVAPSNQNVMISAVSDEAAKPCWKLLSEGEDLYALSSVEDPQMVLTAGEADENGWSNAWMAGLMPLPEQTWRFIQTQISEDSPPAVVEGSTVFVEEGTYRIVCPQSGLVLTAAGREGDRQRRLLLWKDMSLATQQFELKRNADETYTLSLSQSDAAVGSVQGQEDAVPALDTRTAADAFRLVCEGNNLYGLENEQGLCITAEKGGQAGSYVHMSRQIGEVGSHWILEKTDE